MTTARICPMLRSPTIVLAHIPFNKFMTPEEQQLINDFRASFAPSTNPEVERQLQESHLIERDIDALMIASSRSRVKLEPSNMIPVLEELLEEEDKRRIIGKLQSLGDEAKSELIKIASLRAFSLLSKLAES